MDAIMERMTDIGHPALPPHGHMRPLQMDAHDSAAASIIYQIVIIFFSCSAVSRGSLVTFGRRRR